MRKKKKVGERGNRSPFFARRRVFYMHPLFVGVGIFYAFKGELFLFLLSTLVAIEHELAHAFAAARLGYKLNKIILMPFGAVIDGDMNANFKDEILVALWGPLANLITAGVFVAVWWFQPTVYAFTDTAYYTSLSIALVNLLPAYPLDGGRILRCVLSRAFAKKQADEMLVRRRAERVCKGITITLSFFFLVGFVFNFFEGRYNVSLLFFALFLLFGGLGNKDGAAVYEKIDFSVKKILEKGAEIKRVAVLENRPIKDVFKFLSSGNYLVLEIYDEQERHLFDLSQNEFAQLFYEAENSYVTFRDLRLKNGFFREKIGKNG